MGVKSSSGLCFYDWESQELVRRIDIQPKNVFWSENGEMCCITTDESYFILKYVQENVTAALENKDEMVTEDGIEEAFDVLGEIEEIIKTGVWVGDCFIYTNSGELSLLRKKSALFLNVMHYSLSHVFPQLSDSFCFLLQLTG